MRIVDHDELSSASQQQVHLLDMTAGWGALDFSDINQARKTGYPATDYFGVYAVEGGEVLSAVRVIRFPFTTPNEVRQVAGIQGVVTRRDTGRKGLAYKLLEEVHRRERASGKKFAMLWTGRGVVAHGLAVANRRPRRTVLCLAAAGPPPRHDCRLGRTRLL